MGCAVFLVVLSGVLAGPAWAPPPDRIALPSLWVCCSSVHAGPRLDAPPRSSREMLSWVWTLPAADPVLCPPSKGSTGFCAACPCVYRGHCGTCGLLKALGFPFSQLIAGSGQPGLVAGDGRVPTCVSGVVSRVSAAAVRRVRHGLQTQSFHVAQRVPSWGDSQEK